MTSENEPQIENLEEKLEVKSKFRKALDFFKTDLGLFILVFIAFRLLFFFFRMNPYDNYIYYQEGVFVADGNLVYRDIYAMDPVETGIGRHLHPPLSYYYLAFLILIGGKDYLLGMYLLKATSIIFEFLVSLLTYKILLEHVPRKKAYYVILIWITNPIMIFAISYASLYEIKCCFLMVLSFYYFKKKRKILSAFLISLATHFSIFPIIFVLPYSIIFLHEKDFKGLIQFLLFVAFFMILGFLPPLILDPPSFFQFISRMTTYKTSIFSLSHEMESALKTTLFTIDLGFLKIELIFKSFIQIFLALGFYLYLFFDSQRKEYLSANFQIVMMIKTIIFAMVLTMSTHFRIFVWLTPFLLVYFYSNYHTSFVFDENEVKSFIKIAFIIALITATSLAILYIINPIHIPNPGELITHETYLDWSFVASISGGINSLIYLIILNKKVKDKNAVIIIILEMVFLFVNIISFYIR